MFPESSQKQAVMGEEYEPAEPAEPIDDVIIDDSCAEESIADEQQAQESEPIYIAAVSAPTLSI